MHLRNIDMLYLLWLAVPIVALFVHAALRRRAALSAFAAAELHERIGIPRGAGRRLWKAALQLAAVLLVVFSLTRPGWNPQPRIVEQRGRDVVFLLDVSRSMLAADLSPSRLWHARQAIIDCMEQIRGDRIALVAFAGSAVVKCPLTLDHGFFRMALEGVGPDGVTRGGTAIGDAIRTALDDVFDDQARDCRDIVLITDGEDHDSYPVEAAKQAGEKGVRLIIVGLGDEHEGRRVPVVDESGRQTFLSYNGMEVWTRLDAKTLREMANATPGGKYLNVATGALMNLGQVYAQLAAGEQTKELQSRTVDRYEEKFQVFLACAFALLCVEMMISERGGRT